MSKLLALLSLLLLLSPGFPSNLEQCPASFQGESIMKTVSFTSSSKIDMRDFVTATVMIKDLLL